MKLLEYKNQICDIDTSLLAADEYCFSVLEKILRGECRLTLTDERRIIICHSSDPYPVWVWLSDDATEDEVRHAFHAVKSHFGFGCGYRFNLKYKTAETFIRLAAAEGETLSTTTNMLAYSCPMPIAPTRRAEGECRPATVDDVDTAVRFMDLFHNDIGLDKADISTYRSRIERLIADGHLFLWYNGGEAVAMTSYDVSGNKARVGNVYTMADRRRRGFGASLVHAVTELIIKNGDGIPTLYTDADYAPSNACYESIGYVKRGSLCTIE